MTFDFWPGWCFLDKRGRQHQKGGATSSESVAIMFAVWDIGERTESLALSPRSSGGLSSDEYEFQAELQYTPAEIEARRAKNAKRAAARKKAKKTKKAIKSNEEAEDQAGGIGGPQ